MELDSKLYRTAREFSRELQSSFGNEKGHKMWMEVCEVIGKDFSRRLFMDMMRGRTDSITLTGVAGTAYDYKTSKYGDFKKINAIKLARSVSGLGLKESKELIERVQVGQKQEIVFPETYTEEQRNQVQDEFTDAGVLWK